MVELFKKTVSYKDSNGEEKTATNFYCRCGTSALIPIEVKFFADKEDGKDRAYANRKAILSAFAEQLPDNEEKSK